MAKYVFADPHFDSENIIGFGERPFKTIAEMNIKIIANYNAIVGKNDLCYWLGDVMYDQKKEKVRHLLRILHGRKYLIMGNHDRNRSVSWWLDCGFDRVYDTPIYLPELLIMLSHEPMEEFGTSEFPIANIHGHIHIQDYDFKQHDKCVNVCLEKTDYKPVELKNPFLKILPHSYMRE